MYFIVYKIKFSNWYWLEKFKTISAIEVKASCEKAYWKLDYALLNEKKKLTE